MPAGATGELWLQGPELFSGYIDPEQTRAAIDARLAPQRRPRHDRRRRLAHDRRPDQGRDHPRRREHLGGRGRVGARGPSGGTAGGRRRIPRRPARRARVRVRPHVGSVRRRRVRPLVRRSATSPASRPRSASSSSTSSPSSPPASPTAPSCERWRPSQPRSVRSAPKWLTLPACVERSLRSRSACRCSLSPSLPPVLVPPKHRRGSRCSRP